MYLVLLIRWRCGLGVAVKTLRIAAEARVAEVRVAEVAEVAESGIPGPRPETVLGRPLRLCHSQVRYDVIRIRQMSLDVVSIE